MLERAVAAGLDPDRTRLREVMRADFETIDAGAPVVEGDRVLGVLELGHPGP